LSTSKKFILVSTLFFLGFWLQSFEIKAFPSGGGHAHTFSLNKTSLCIGDTLWVKDTCIHDAFQPTSRLWSFSQGAQPSILQNQSQGAVVFSTPGLKIITLSVYDIFNVAYTDTMQIRVLGAIADAGISKKFCDNTSGVLIGTLDTTAAIANWTDVNGASVGNGRVISVAPSQSCFYYLSVIKGSCVTRDSVWVQKVYAPIVNAGNNATICNGASVVLGTAPQSNMSYLWFPSTGLTDSSIAQPTAKPITNTIYTLFITDTNNCRGNAQVTVNVVNNLIANPGSSFSVCQGDSIKIGTPQQAGWTYQWSPSQGLNNPTLAQPLAFPKANTNYQLKVSAYGCTDSNSVLVVVKPLPIVDLGTKHLYYNCFHDSTLVGASPLSGYTYLWSPSSNISNTTSASTLIFPNKDTWYKLQVRGPNACLNKDSLFVDVFDSIKAYAGLSQSICLGNSIILGAQQQVASGGSGKYIYQWSPGNSLSNFTLAHPVAKPNNLTRYYLTVIDSINSNCGSAQDSVDITIFHLPSFQLPFKKMFCTGDAPIALNATPSGGQFFVQIKQQQYPISNNVLNPNDTIFHLGKPYLIRYFYTSPQGCTYDTAVSIIVKDRPRANAGQDILYCSASGNYNLQLLGSGIGGTPHWIPAIALNNDTIYNPTVVVLQSQSFILQVDNGACFAQDTVQFTVCFDSVILFANYDQLHTKINCSDSVSIESNDFSSADKYDHSLYTITRACTNGIGFIKQTKQSVIFSYVPNKNFVGFDTAIYILRDTFGLRVYEDTAMILISVAPSASNDSLSTVFGNINCFDSIVSITKNDHYAPSTKPTVSILSTSKNGSFTTQGLDLIFHTNNKVFVESIQYVLTQNGVSDTAIVYLDYNCPSCQCKLPEGFSPNNDGKNDYLELINTNNCIPDCSLIIYNRWGNVVYRSEHYETKWDGKYNGTDLPDGTYFYQINSAENTNAAGKTTGYLILQR
jgi:gliding motility-associated-like protein